MPFHHNIHHSPASRAAMESAPLLTPSGALPGGVVQDHPAFLRASHSPWGFIPQNVLVFFRGLIVLYIIVTLTMAADFKFSQSGEPPAPPPKFLVPGAVPGAEDCKWSFLFSFVFVSALLVLIYHIIAFSWTFTHLYFPNPEELDGSFESWLINMMSLPDNMASTRKQFRFTLFYTVTAVFSFMNSGIYWFITRANEAPDPGQPKVPGKAPDVPNPGALAEPLNSLADMLPAVPNTPFSDLFGQGWFKPFVIFNLYGILSIIMVIEILFLNSIKRPFAVGSHLLGIMFTSILYLCWATIGKILTGCYAFFWLDDKKVGSQEAVIFYSIGFVLLAPLAWVFMQGLVGVRENFLPPRVIIQPSPLGS